MFRLALLGFPSVEEVVRKVVDLLFGALSQALLPDFLRDGTVEAIKWLVAVPNPADPQLWPNVAQLESNMAALGFGLLGLTFVVAAVRYTLTGIAGGPHPMVALSHAVAAAAGIVVYRWAFANAVALVNVLTNQILSWPVVSHGLGRTVKVMFGGSLLVGSGSVFLSLVALITIFFAVSLFVMKVAVLMITAILYVAGPAVIALYPLQEAARFTRLWLYAALAVTLVPLGWCVIFATAGAISLDVTSFGELGAHGTATVVGAKTTGAFAGLLMFALAALWPFKLGRQLGGLPAMTGIAGSGGSSGATQVGARVKAAQARLRVGALAAGGVVGAAAGAAGAPRGGLVGAATRGGTSLYKRTATSVGKTRPASAARPTTSSVASQPTDGTAPAERAGDMKSRAGAAAAVLREGPAQVRAAMSEAAGARKRPRTGGEDDSRGAGARAPASLARPGAATTAVGSGSGAAAHPREPAQRPAQKSAGARVDGAASVTNRSQKPRKQVALPGPVRPEPAAARNGSTGRGVRPLAQPPSAGVRKSRKRRKVADR